MGSLCGLGVFFAFFAVQIFSGLVIPQGVTNPTTSKIFAQGPAPARHRTVFLILPRLTIPPLLPMAVPKSGPQSANLPAIGRRERRSRMFRADEALRGSSRDRGIRLSDVEFPTYARPA